MRTDMGFWPFTFVIASVAIRQTLTLRSLRSRRLEGRGHWPGLHPSRRAFRAPQDEGLRVELAPRSASTYFLSLKYGSTGPCTLMVSGLPWRSFALPAGGGGPPSLVEDFSTIVFSPPLKGVPPPPPPGSPLL